MAAVNPAQWRDWAPIRAYGRDGRWQAVAKGMAAHYGLKAGDKIIAVDGTAVSGSEQIIKKTLGKAGTPVRINDPECVGKTFPDYFEALFDVDFTSVDEGWAVGVTGQIVRTTDGGHTWQYEQLPTIRDLLAIEFHSHDVGWICGGKGSVFSTKNAGVWSQFENSPTHTLTQHSSMFTS